MMAATAAAPTAKTPIRTSAFRRICTCSWLIGTGFLGSRRSLSPALPLLPSYRAFFAHPFVQNGRSLLEVHRIHVMSDPP
jgi:hypothetical protein